MVGGCVQPTKPKLILIALLPVPINKTFYLSLRFCYYQIPFPFYPNIPKSW
jgi:hypothetical protein